MPELPEVETTRRGIAPYLEGHAIIAVVVREPRLRWPVPSELAAMLSGQVVRAVERRAKYLLIQVACGTLIIHLGMSGSLRIVPPERPLRKHDHVTFRLATGLELRLHDPRRFGAVLWQALGATTHPVLATLGPEPLGPEFTADYLFARSRGRRTTIKQFLMDNQVVVGVGNIYANESLFSAGIHPRRAAGRIAAVRYRVLVDAIKAVLEAAIAQGGTTLRDFLREDGSPGYFSLKLNVYDRAGEPCVQCARPIVRAVIGQRAAFFCPHCQR
ncbi:MAG: bifunctional DNA-formamidopyrimidine glycosylase/DNA-(apurinic or apyrimidinic site) lyase [Thiotrichales bacterium]